MSGRGGPGTSTTNPCLWRVEDLVQVDARWSKEARLQESPLLAYGDYRQDLLFTEEIQGYELRYEITDVKVPFLYDLLRMGSSATTRTKSWRST